jgi:hypothetical protein
MDDLKYKTATRKQQSQKKNEFASRHLDIRAFFTANNSLWWATARHVFESPRT